MLEQAIQRPARRASVARVNRPELLLVAPSAQWQKQARRIDRVMVDLEQQQKWDRQSGYNTQINQQDFQDVRDAVAINSAPVLARINPLHHATPMELQRVLDCGADSVMLPMAANCGEVELFFQMVARAQAPAVDQVIIQVETLALFAQARELAQLAQWFNRSQTCRASFYVGFNDLMIQRGDAFLWQPLLDGTLAAFCGHFPPFSVGFGGLTLPERGEPIPSIELMAEMASLNCGLTVLRRSFMRDVQTEHADQAIAQIHLAFEQLLADPALLQDYRARLHNRLRTLKLKGNTSP